MEVDNYDVTVKNQDENLVGHVPKELSRLFHKFLNDQLENLRQNALEIGSMQAKEMELKSLLTSDLRPMIHIWESSRGII